MTFAEKGDKTEQSKHYCYKQHQTQGAFLLMNNIRRVVFEVLQELEGIKPKVETKNSNSLKEIKAVFGVCLTEIGEITNKKIGRWRKLKSSPVSQYEKIAYSLAHKYAKGLPTIDQEDAFSELVSAGMEGIAHGLTHFTPGYKTEVSTFVYGRAKFAIQKQFHAMKKHQKKYISLNIKIDDSNEDANDFQTMMASTFDIEEHVEQKIQHQLLRTALAKLTPEYRRIAMMCSELSVNQVAKKINKPVKEVNLVLAKLKKQINSIKTFDLDNDIQHM